MVEQSKKETILGERSASSIELKGSSLTEPALLPSASLKDELASEEAKVVAGAQPIPADSETNFNCTSAGSPEQTIPTSAGDVDQEPKKDSGISDFNSNRALSPFQRTQLATDKNSNLRPAGLMRHKLVMGACFLFSISFLGLCALDLKSAFATPALIDRSFKLTYPEKRPSLPPNLTYLNDSEQGTSGFYRVVESSWNKSNVGLIDKNGNLIVKPQYTTIGDFKDGLALVSKTKDSPLKKIPGTNRSYLSEDVFGYIDETGKVVIEPHYREARSFKDGVALVSTNVSNSTLIDRLGKVIFSAETQCMATDLGSVYSITEKNGRTGLIDKNGHHILPAEYDGVTAFYNYETWSHSYADSYRGDDLVPEKFLRISRDGKCGVIDLKGNIIIPPIFQDILSYENGHAVIGEDGKYGFADSHGKVVIKPTYDFVTAYDDLIAVRDDSKWKFINGLGNTVNGAHIDGVLLGKKGRHWLHDGRGAVIIGDLCGYVDKSGALVVKPIYLWARAFQDGFAQVYDGKFWHYIDRSGQLPANVNFSATTDIPLTGFATVYTAGPLYGFGEGAKILSKNENYKNTVEKLKGKSD